ncbi:hypothetical protein MAP00_009067 [Monascus purpureus]|nr:hypothetical protein MAP00_009067 [Monascus purpureus]
MSSSISSDPHPWLREIYRGVSVKAIVVLVPGIGIPLDRWQNGDGGMWLKSMPPTSSPEIAVYSFEHNIKPDDSFSWNSVFESGDRLFRELTELTGKDTQSCPIIIISHSLGGIIAKEAINRLSQFSELWKNMAGAIFLGTPHSTSPDVHTWEKAGAILRLYARTKNAPIRPNPKESEKLAQICSLFEQVFNQIPVLSAYETSPTRIGSFLSSKVLLVSRELAAINISSESLVQVEASHDKLCCLQVGSYPLDQISSFLESTFEKVRQNMQQYVPPLPMYEEAGGTSVGGSVLNMQEKEQELMREVSNLATQGSSSFGFEVIPLISGFDVDRKDPRLPCYIMPSLPRNHTFFGRSEILEEMKKILLVTAQKETQDLPEESRLPIVALYGPGGMGKTQIAAEFVYSLQSSFDAIFWLQADEEVKLSQGYTEIATKLGLVLEDSADARDPVIVRDLVKAWLQSPLKTYQRQENSTFATWLLVYDNLDNISLIEDYMPSSYACEGAGALLITSRDPLVKQYVASDDSAAIALPPFTTEEAVEFLLKLTCRQNEDSERESGNTVAERLGGYPLALTQMAGIISRQQLSFAEFLRVFEEEEVRSRFFKMQGNPRKRGSYQHTLDTVWALGKLSRAATMLLGVLSFLDPDSIPEYILRDVGSKVDVEDYPKTEAEYNEARTELLQSSLIARDWKTQRITIHRLVQDGARSKMSQERYNLIFYLTVRLLFLAWAFEEFSYDYTVSTWATNSVLFPHLSQLHRHSSKAEIPHTVTLGSLELSRLLSAGARFHHRRGMSSESTPYLNTAMSRCKTLQKNLEGHHDSESKALSKVIKVLIAEIHHDLASAAIVTNQMAVARAHFSAAYEIRLEFAAENPGKADRNLIIATNEMGNTHMIYKEWTQACEVYRRTVDMIKQLDVDTIERVDLLSVPMANLACVNWILGRLEEGVKIATEALAARKALYGSDDTKSMM